MKLRVAAAGAASGIILAVVLGAWTIVRSASRTPRDAVLLHIPDDWQVVTVIRPTALDRSRKGDHRAVLNLLDDPLDRAFPAEADNVDEVFDVQFSDGGHVRFWTFHSPPAQQNIVGQASPSGNIRGVDTWQHRLGRLAMPDPRIVAAAQSSAWLETVVLEGMVRMRPIANPPQGDFVVHFNLEGSQVVFNDIRAHLATLSASEPSDMTGFRQISLEFYFSDPAAVEIELTADSRAHAAEYKRRYDADQDARRSSIASSRPAPSSEERPNTSQSPLPSTRRHLSMAIACASACPWRSKRSSIWHSLPPTIPARIAKKRIGGSVESRRGAGRRSSRIARP